MPLYMRDDKAVFQIHVPKTGGTALHALFMQNNFVGEYWEAPMRRQVNRYRRNTPQHMTADQLTSIFRTNRFEFLFITVRDPLKRAVSEYKMRLRAGIKLEPIHIWFENMIRLYVDEPTVSDNHMRPQVDFLLPTAEIFRHEDGYEKLLDRIELRTGLVMENRQMPRLNATPKQFVDPADIEKVAPRVREFYWQDYARLGY